MGSAIDVQNLVPCASHAARLFFSLAQLFSALPIDTLDGMSLDSIADKMSWREAFMARNAA